MCSFPLCFGPKLRKSVDTNFDKRVYISKVSVTEFGSKQWAIISRQAMVSNRIIMTQTLGTGSRHISDRKPLKKETCIFYSGEATEGKGAVEQTHPNTCTHIRFAYIVCGWYGEP